PPDPAHRDQALKLTRSRGGRVGATLDPGATRGLRVRTVADSDWGCPTPLEDIAGEIAIVGVGESAHTRASGRSPKEIAAEAVERALADAGLPPSAIDGLMYAPFMGGQFDAAAFHAHFGTSHDLWVSERGGGMVWAGTAPYDAALADYLASPPLVDPFRKEDCCLISDGGGAYVMTSVERARDLRQPFIEVAGVGLGNSYTGTYWSQQGAFTSTPQVFAAPGAFAMAGLTPADVDVLTLYDPFTIVALMQIEDMGFCRKGEGGAFVEGTALHFDGGVLPYNTHGGMLSHAYVLGIAHVVETVRQVRGEAAAQVSDAEVGVYGGCPGPQASTR